MNFIDKNLHLNSLKELRINQMEMSLFDLELILHSTPNLRNLYLKNFKISFESLSNLSQWENLINLQRFEFYFICNDFNVNEIDFLINSFERSFKHLIINFEFNCSSRWKELIVYSSIKSSIFFPHQCDYKTIFCSTSTMINHNLSKRWNVYLTANHNFLSYDTQWVKSLFLFILKEKNIF
jgi:hypothetical protein